MQNANASASPEAQALTRSYWRKRQMRFVEMEGLITGTSHLSHKVQLSG